MPMKKSAKKTGKAAISGNTPVRGVRIDDRLWVGLGRVADAEDRDRGWVIRRAIEDFFKRGRK